MIRISVLAAVALLFAAGCNKEASSKEKGKDTSAATQKKSSHKADKQAERQRDDAHDNGASAPKAAFGGSIPPVSTQITNYAELVAALEKRRIALDKRERDLLARERAVARLEETAIGKRGELERLQQAADKAVARAEDKAKAALERIRLAQERAQQAIDADYAAHHQKLLAAYEELKRQHAAFIRTELAKIGLEGDNLDAQVAAVVKARQERVNQLVQAIEGMNAPASARMLASMQVEDAVEVLRAVSSTKSAEIFAAMKPEQAATLAQAMLGPKVTQVASLADLPVPDAPKTATTQEKKQ